MDHIVTRVSNSLITIILFLTIHNIAKLNNTDDQYEHRWEKVSPRSLSNIRGIQTIDSISSEPPAFVWNLIYIKKCDYWIQTESSTVCQVNILSCSPGVGKSFISFILIYSSWEQTWDEMTFITCLWVNNPSKHPLTWHFLKN